MYVCLWNCTIWSHTTKERLGSSVGVIAPRRVQKVWRFLIFWRVQLFFLLIFQISKVLRKKSLIVKVLLSRFVRSWHLFCVRNLNYVKNLITIQIQTVSSLNSMSKVNPTQGSTSTVVSGCAQWSILFIFFVRKRNRKIVTVSIKLFWLVSLFSSRAF